MTAKLEEVEFTEQEAIDELNELYGEVDICGLKYSAGYALKEIDPTAFRCYIADKEIQYQCSECSMNFDSDEEDEGKEHVKTCEG